MFATTPRPDYFWLDVHALSQLSRTTLSMDDVDPLSLPLSWVSMHQARVLDLYAG